MTEIMNPLLLIEHNLKLQSIYCQLEKINLEICKALHTNKRLDKVLKGSDESSRILNSAPEGYCQPPAKIFLKKKKTCFESQTSNNISYLAMVITQEKQKNNTQLDTQFEHTISMKHKL